MSSQPRRVVTFDGEALRDWRERAGLTAAETARRARISTQRLWQIETGRRSTVFVSTAWRIRGAIGAPEDAQLYAAPQPVAA